MSHPLNAFLVLAAVLAAFAYKRRISHIANTMRAEYEKLLTVRSEGVIRPCERLLHSLEESKSIAEKALSPGLGPDDVRHALREILTRLSRAVA